MKNKFMRIAAVMLMLCLVTTCAISGTFAKYTNEISGSDTARVATWGFNGTNNDIILTNLFKDAYDKNVQGTADVIAPGTTNSATFSFKYAGQELAPEVAYTLEVNASESTIAADLKNANIVWALVEGGTAPAADSTEWGTWDKMIEELEGLDGATDGAKQYDAGDLADMANETYTIAWMWIFEGTAGDAVDTALGNKAALDTVKVAIKITATQVD